MREPQKISLGWIGDADHRDELFKLLDAAQERDADMKYRDPKGSLFWGYLEHCTRCGVDQPATWFVGGIRDAAQLLSGLAYLYDDADKTPPTIRRALRCHLDIIFDGMVREVAIFSPEVNVADLKSCMSMAPRAEITDRIVSKLQEGTL
jgi:hypothetical protein